MNSCLPPYGRYPGAVTRICPSASLYRCAIYSGRLSCTQILEAADTIGVTTFLCRILDTAFGVFSTWHFGEWRLTLALPLRATMRRESSASWMNSLITSAVSSGTSSIEKQLTSYKRRTAYQGWARETDSCVGRKTLRISSKPG